MDDADAVSLQNVHVPLRHRNAVRRRRGRIERAERFEPLRRRFAVALDALALLARGLGEVDVHAPALFAAEVAVRLDDMALAGILRVDGKVNVNAPVRRAVVLFKKRERFGDLRVLLHGLVFVKALHTAVQVRLDPRLFDRPDGLLGEKVHIGKARRAARDHLDQGKAARCGDILAHELVLDRENGLEEPVLQRQSAADAAHQRHGDMAVAVDESRGKEPAAHVLFKVIGLFGFFLTDIVDLRLIDAEIGAVQRFISVFLAQQNVRAFQECSHKRASYLHFISLCSLSRVLSDCNGQKD